MTACLVPLSWSTIFNDQKYMLQRLNSTTLNLHLPICMGILVQRCRYGGGGGEVVGGGISSHLLNKFLCILFNSPNFYYMKSSNHFATFVLILLFSKETNQKTGFERSRG